jgi:hypothetical protein
MILVDTSVLIYFLKGKTDNKVELFQLILAREVPFGIPCYTYQEILQGTKDEKEWQILKNYCLPKRSITYRKHLKLTKKRLSCFLACGVKRLHQAALLIC